MRNFLLLSCFVLFYPTLISQNLNFAEHKAVDMTGEMVSIHSKFYYLYETEYSCCSSDIYLVCRDDSGNEVFRKYVGYDRGNKFGRLIKTKDNALLMTGASLHACDLGPGPEFIVKIDTNGTIIFQTVITSLTSWLSPKITGITQHPDSSYYLVSASDLYHYSPTGQFISKISSGLSAVSSIKALATGDLLINGTLNAARQNVIMTTTGSITIQQTCSYAITKFIETPTYIIARTANGEVEKYSSTLSLQNTSALTYSAYVVNDVDLRNDSLFITGLSAGSPFYTILNASFSQLYYTAPNYHGIKPTGIAINRKNTVQIITTGFSAGSTLYPFTGLYRMPLNGYFNSHSDIGIVSFSNVNTVLLGSGPSTIYTPYVNMDVTVKNYSVDTVKSFYLNYYAYFNSGISQCYILLHNASQTAITPGGTLTIPSVSFYAQPYYKNGTGSINDFTKLNLCLFTTVPNQSNDVNISNDAFCDSIIFTVTGVLENSPLSQSIFIFPNPFIDGLSISSEISIQKIIVENCLGKVIDSVYPESKEVKYENTALLPGIYFMKIETEKGSTVKKILKN